MKKLNLGQTIGLLANLGVIAGIIFLAIELRQNNELLGAEVRSIRMENRVSLSAVLFENPEVIELLGKERSSLSQAEQDRIRLLGIRALIMMEWNYGEAIRGFQDLDAVTGALQAVYHRDRLNYGAPLAWEASRESLDPQFADWFEENVVNRR